MKLAPRHLLRLHRVPRTLWERWRIARTLRGGVPDWPLWRRREHGRALLAALPPATTPAEPARVERLALLDEESLRRALARLYDSGGGILELPAGVLVLRAPLDLPPRTGLRGAAECETLLAFEGVRFGIRMAGTGTTPHEGGRVERLNLAHRDAGDLGAAIYAANARGPVIRQVRISDASAAGIILADDVDDAIVEDCAVERSRMVGIALLRGVRRARLARCVVAHSDQGGLLLCDLPCPPGVPREEIGEQFRRGTTGTGSAAPYDIGDPCPLDVLVEDCRLEGNRKMGVSVDGAGALALRRCAIEGNDGEGITLDNGTFDALVEDCVIRGNGRRGRATAEELDRDRVSEAGRNAEGESLARLPGISMDNALGCQVLRSRIEANWGDGLKTVRAVARCEARGNDFAGNGRGTTQQFRFHEIMVWRDPREHPGQWDFHPFGNDFAENRFAPSLRPPVMSYRAAGFFNTLP